MSDLTGPTIIPFRPPPGLSPPGEEESLYEQFPNLSWNNALYPGMEQQDFPPLPEEYSEDSPTSGLDPVSSNKEVRKLEKKLRDITKLETKLAAGDKVDPLQVKKIEKKKALEDELTALRQRLTEEMMEAEKQPFEGLAPPPGFNQLPAGKFGLASFSKLSTEASLVDACEDDATTLPGSTASDQGCDSDSESQVSELLTRQLSASAPVFVPQGHSAFLPMMPMPFVPMEMAVSRTPLKNTAALFTPTTLRQDAPIFVPQSVSPVESSCPKVEEEEKISWRSSRSRMEEQPEEKSRTKLTAGSAELFVPQFPDLKASMDMKSKEKPEKAKAKRVTQI